MLFRRIAGLIREILQIVLMLGLVLAVRTAVAAPNYVPSGSMEPTLQIGDALLSTKYAYGYSRYSTPIDLGPSLSGRWLGRLPEQGDVVVFQAPSHPQETWVKRVVGLPGDRLQMRDGFLWINGERLPVTRDGADAIEAQDGGKILAARYVETLPNGRQHFILKQTTNGLLDNTPEVVVPADHVFMMGDNRDHSWDSRAPRDIGGIGFVPVENLVGRSEIVLGSWDFPNAKQGVTHWIEGLRLSRFFSRIS
jgi:signal peptidase I